MVDYWKMLRRICKITVTLDFIFRLVLCSREDVSFNSICLHVLEGIKQFYLSMWIKKNRLETPFKGDNVKALIKMVLYSGFFFQWPNNRLKMVLASPNDQKYPRHPLVLKFNVTLARPLRVGILYF